MTKENINRLKKAMKNCISNAEFLLWGDDTEFPTSDDIEKANKLIEMAVKIDAIIDERS